VRSVCIRINEMCRDFSDHDLFYWCRAVTRDQWGFKSKVHTPTQRILNSNEHLGLCQEFLSRLEMGSHYVLLGFILSNHREALNRRRRSVNSGCQLGLPFTRSTRRHPRETRVPCGYFRPTQLHNVSTTNSKNDKRVGSKGTW
jgi:hypothetical protein